MICRKAQESQREMKLLLDMYRSAPKEQRDKVQLMAAEKKAKSEVTDTAMYKQSTILHILIPIVYLLHYTAYCVHIFTGSWIHSSLASNT